MNTYFTIFKNEGLPNILLETMTLGKSVIATKVRRTPALITHNVSGDLVPAGNVETINITDKNSA